jgi:hypothetical protein
MGNGVRMKEKRRLMQRLEKEEGEVRMRWEAGIA